jgi:plasmid stabilization system protein ParE
MEVIWSGDAKADFKDGLAWLDERNPAAAVRFETDVDAAVQLLATHPGMGRPSSTIGFRLLSLVKWHRRITYEIHDDFVYVVSIKHTRQGEKS